MGSLGLLKIYKEKGYAMIIKSNVKAGKITTNHNEKLARNKKSLAIKSGVKACGIATNHNEKLTGNINTTEQKKSIGKKLRLSKETVRALTDSDLMKAIGGVRPSTYTKGPSGPEDGPTTC